MAARPSPSRTPSSPAAPSESTAAQQTPAAQGGRAGWPSVAELRRRPSYLLAPPAHGGHLRAAAPDLAAPAVQLSAAQDPPLQRRFKERRRPWNLAALKIRSWSLASPPPRSALLRRRQAPRHRGARSLLPGHRRPTPAGHRWGGGHLRPELAPIAASSNADEQEKTAGVVPDPWPRGWRARPGGAATQRSGRRT